MLEPQLWFLPPQAPDPCFDDLSAQERRWGQALPALRRSQYWRSRALMRQRLAVALGLPPAQVPLHSPPGEPPRLAAGSGRVSLSHGAGALLIGWGPDALGVDLEAADRRFDAAALLQRFFPPAEQRQLAVLALEPLRAAVLRSWLVKEAAIKWRQRTLAQELLHWCFDHVSGDLRHLRDDTLLRPAEGRVGCWRWAAVGGASTRLPSAPLIWPFDDG